jgi:putative hemolysin
MTDLLFFLGYASLAACALLVGLFAASEAALAATNRVRLRQLLRSQSLTEGEKGERASSGALSDDEQRFLATVTVAANVPLVAAASLAVWLAWESFSDVKSVLALSLCAALVTVVVFQIAPRLLAERASNNRLWWVRPAHVLVAILRPFVSLMLIAGTLVLRPLGLLPASPSQSDSESGLENASELRDLVESAQASGVLDENRELIESIFTFGDTRVHEVMIPRPDIVSLPCDSGWDHVFDLLQESGLSRLPVHEGDIDTVIGVLHAKDLLQALNAEDDLGRKSLRELMREPVYLPEALKIDEALESMRARRSHLAIVIDEFGGTAGLLTVEDILEELVGEIADEHDVKAEDPFVILDSERALADARLHVEDLESLWGLSLPPGEFDTVGGVVIERLGRAPVAGDRIETEEAILTVHTVRQRRPKTILIQRKVAQPPSEEPAPPRAKNS